MTPKVFKDAKGYFKLVELPNRNCSGCALAPTEMKESCYRLNRWCNRGQMFNYASEDEYLLAKLKGETG